MSKTPPVSARRRQYIASRMVKTAETGLGLAAVRFTLPNLKNQKGLNRLPLLDEVRAV
jgi:hypothetical protein